MEELLENKKPLVIGIVVALVIAVAILWFSGGSRPSGGPAGPTVFNEAPSPDGQPSPSQ